ncbi:MAG: hypothetical protein ACRDXX_03835 [Stackebrandtia sp.]
MAKVVHSGHAMPAHVGVMTEELAKSARRYKIAGYLVGVFVLVIMPYLGMENVAAEGGSVWDVVGYVALGYVCGVPLFAGVPWMVGFTKQRQAGERLFLNGTQLTVVGMVGGGGNVFDLRNARMEVELIGGVHEENAAKQLAQGNRVLLEQRQTQVGRGEINASKHYAVPYHPVLVLYREADGMAIPVELCHVGSRQMRDPREIYMLVQAMQFNPDPRARHVAGQLRTIARWRQLPHILDADPHAVPATPADYPEHAPVIPTPVRAGEPAPEIQVTGPAG